ncbi:MAG: HAMP domain-containing protein [Proteobacteria bacterium]|nr:HAMP domain-containing protein [Pseudomonadota bacterium]
MNIRNRITLLITGVGILASLLFSLIVFYEMLEQPYKLIDTELDQQAHYLLSALAPQASLASSSPESTLQSIGSFYWVKVFDEKKVVVYESEMSHLLTFPLYEKEDAYTITTRIKNTDLKGVHIDQDDTDEVTFRVRFFSIPKDGHLYTVQIAKSMGDLTEEISELLISLFVGLIVSAIVLLSVGYYVAGRILAPIRTINRLIHEINDKTLDKRIPPGETHDELYDLKSSLNEMFDRLQYSFTRQKEFIANASHELKTPITLLRLFFDENVCQPGLPDVFRDKLISQQATLSRMDRLVRNLLDLSVLECKKSYEPEEYDLVGQIHSVLKEFAEIFKTEGIRITVSMPSALSVFADREKIRRVLINLIDNAIKYNQTNGEIRVRGNDETDKITLEIYNTGTGIAQEELGKVFDQFYRVEKSRSIAHGGSGLGLSIVKRIVELHGGTITIESDAGAWAQVRILLPKQV